MTGGGSMFESVSQNTVADSNIGDEYDALDTLGKEHDKLKEGGTKSISDTVGESAQPSYVDTLIPSSSGAAASSSGAAAAISESELDDYKERNKVYDGKTDDQLRADYKFTFYRQTKAKRDNTIK